MEVPAPYPVPRSGLALRFENEEAPCWWYCEIAEADLLRPKSAGRCCCCCPCCEGGRRGCVDPPVDGREDVVALGPGVDADIGRLSGVSDERRRSWRD